MSILRPVVATKQGSPLVSPICPQCFIMVAPGDPHQKQGKDGRTYHGNCSKK